MIDIKGKRFVMQLKVGLIQTAVHNLNAWQKGPRMSPVEEIKASNEISRAFSAFSRENEKPEIILLPELAAPRGIISDLRRYAEQLNAVIISGIDYMHHVGPPKAVSNEAMIFVPRRWRSHKRSGASSLRTIGKTYPAAAEETLLANAGYDFKPDPNLYIFEGGEIGRFAVVICFDLLDIERAAMYRGQIDHLFVLAYNRDHTSFNHVAEALSRMIFCNVVICNTGHHGGSVAVSPLKKPWLRTIYRHEGMHLFTTQVIELPVAALRARKHNVPFPLPDNPDFKALPPGFKNAATLVVKKDTI